MKRYPLVAVALALASYPAFAQDVTTAAGGRCTTPDTVAVRGNSRISDATIRSDAGLTAGTQLNYRSVQRAISGLFDTGEYEDVQAVCEILPGDKALLTIVVRERPVLESIDLAGFKTVSRKTATDSVEIPIGRPLDPSSIARLVARVDSLYAKQGYYLAKVSVDSTRDGDKVKIVVRVSEGSRLAVSGLRIEGNHALSDKAIAGAMKTRPEGFFWFRRGEFDEDKFAGDLGERIPALYAKQGFIDFQVLRDTVIIDRQHGKALLQLQVEEGPQYHVGSFDPSGNKRFSSEEIRRFYPFTGEGPSLTERARGILRRTHRAPKDVFDEAAWDDATQKVRTAYSNEGYIYAQVRPVVDRRKVGPDSTPTVDLRWEIDEARPAIVNRIEIAGNDFTSEACIRDQLVILPGDVFNQDRLIRSYQNIANLGFFETPLPTPDTKTANDEGDIDVIFRVKEKKTGNVNFGASMGGNSLGGFIGLEQPNLFGLCKKGSLQWQFGRYIQDFQLSYSDPAIRGSRVSGTVSAYDSRPRYTISGFGRPRRVGANLQFGFPVPRSFYSRLFASYGLEAQRNDENIEDPTLKSNIYLQNSLRSTLGLTAQHDTRIDMPFPTAGAMQSLTSQFSGGPLGGDANFQRYTSEIFAFAPVGQIGGSKPGSAPIKFVLGMKLRSGAVFGDPGAFFQYQKFILGGVQFGEPLRGYEEFSVTPRGVLPNGSGGTTASSIADFGSAFITTSTEFGIRLNQQIYLDAFFDAGNVWARPQDVNLRLKRGVGFGASIITPIAPLGIDIGYGLDRVNNLGQPAPKWQVHFKLGQIF
ncbi:MAG: outer membrane protein assembly factor BamA [Gemmatimonadaceae bacterium]|nr:outer membrane protein assembly factor BamA [Gemmatimonadaceae bacterium]NUQ94541.1 outer membrane protein assembly factor BamA [Gemmatimonadaceae bacterium]NUR20578.1 outer membrane protein assembly factor BamA [Gemmatimonadaceae bacterium]NUS96714.1 outer membrane protein assembly factor BamA [Gemmatimonadaceae bacterium]